MNYQRNRLVIGGSIGALGCLLLLGTSHPILGFIVLFLGFLSSLRAIFNGAPIIGLLLTKANGFLLLMFPMLWAASVKFQEERTSLAVVEPQAHLKEMQGIRPEPGSSRPDTPESPPIAKSLPEPQQSSRKTSRDAPFKTAEHKNIHNLVRHARELEKGDDIDLVMTLYAETADYFGRRATRKDIFIDKSKYWAKWPVRKETITSSLTFEKPRVNTFRVRFDSSFRNENPSTGAWISGDLKNLYLLERIKNEIFVIGQSCEVSNVKKGAPILPDSQTTQLLGFNSKIVEIPGDLLEKVNLVDPSRHPDAKNLALEAANIVRLTLLAETERNVEETMSSFAYIVRYFKADVSSEAIWIEKEAYFEKWPRAEDELTSRYGVTVTRDSNITVKFTTRFSVTNAQGDTFRTGDIDHVFKLAPWKDELRIVEQDGAVRNLQTKKLK